MYSTYKKGQIAVLKMQERALEKNWDVCFPTVERRYDAILVDEDGKCFRVQTKYVDAQSTSADGSVHVDFRKQTWNNGHTKIYSKMEVDAIIAYIPSAQQLVWLGPKVFHQKKSINLRYQPPKNNQRKRIRMVSDYAW
jgi:hypothetical protein